jgi:HTH-type transcriptional regulator / antitoxin HigA
MKLRVIKTEKEYKAYLDWVDELFEKKLPPDSPEGEELQVALLLIKQYEDAHFQIEATSGNECRSK